MRPLRLSLQAFGSYAETFDVDFARLGRHGVFAITGPTGAGKSTIFDALVYALYNDLPGFRVNGNVRSQYAEPGTETRVCLEFEVHGEEWRIERIPTQLVPRRRGSGATEKKASVLLAPKGVAGDGDSGRGAAAGIGAPAGIGAAGDTGAAITKMAAVAAKVEELVGLTKEQFEQVVLIPQGKFEEVLKADTANRAPLLRQLFPVDLYGRVTEALRSIAGERQQAFDAATRDHAVLVRQLGEAFDKIVEGLPEELSIEGLPGDRFDVDAFAQHLDDLAHVRGELDDLVRRAGTRAEAARAALIEATERAARWRQWQQDLAIAVGFGCEEAEDAAEKSVLDRARRLVHLGTAISEWQAASRRLERSRPVAAEAVAEAQASWLDDYDASGLLGSGPAALLAQRVERDAQDLAKEVERFERLSAERRVIDAQGRSHGERRRVIADALAAARAEEGALGELGARIEALARSAQEIERTRMRADALENELAVASRRAEAERDVTGLKDELDAAAIGVAGARERVEAVRAAWRDGLAGRLAQLLVDGDPCPTCGSATHPRPAALQADSPDDDLLSQAEFDHDAALATWGEAEHRYAAAEGALAALQPSRLIADVGAELAECRARLSAMESAARECARLESERAERADRLNSTRGALLAAERELEVDTATLDVRRAAFDADLQDFVGIHGNFGSPKLRLQSLGALATALRRVSGLLSEVEDGEASLDRIGDLLAPAVSEFGVEDPGGLSAWALGPEELDDRSSHLEARRDRRLEIRQRIAEYERDDGRSDAPDVAPLQAELAAADGRHADLLRRQGVISDRAAFLVTGPDLLEAAAKAIVTARQAFQEAKTLADRCAGLVGGASATRLSLENWVLADYLRQVLVQANERLASMTDGRFALRLSEGVTDGRKPWGLDIAAFDANTGQVRPATTLSGGETFMAALSLALGLADVVSGGSNHDIGALFIDEGFGSLDPQALEAVIDVLRSLEDGGRIVGVISHVDDVKVSLPSGISVEPSPRGSVATLHYPDE